MLQTWNTQSIRKPYLSQSHYFRFRVTYWPIFRTCLWSLKSSSDRQSFKRCVQRGHYQMEHRYGNGGDWFGIRCWWTVRTILRETDSDKRLWHCADCILLIVNFHIVLNVSLTPMCSTVQCTSAWISWITILIKCPICSSLFYLLTHTCDLSKG